MDQPEFVRLLNTEQHSTVDVVLLGAVEAYHLHWDKEGRAGRSRLCIVDAYRHRGVEAPRSLCPRCVTEHPYRGIYYAPVVTPSKLIEGERRRHELALLQVPTAFIAESTDRLVRGRVVRAFDLGCPPKKPRWQLRGVCAEDSLPAAFDVVTVLARITGVAPLPRIPAPAEKPERRDDDGLILRFPA